MHEPDIAPLARRLAEENNVDWRRLQGSGEGGRVVERDVLGYLARVMAGDEAVDPTPEPVPDGMEAWPEADVEAGGRGHTADADSPPTLDDELFLFEDPAPVPADAASVEAAAIDAFDADDDAEPTTVVDAEEGEDDLWLVGDEPQPEPSARPSGADAAAAPEPVEIEPVEIEPAEIEPADDETDASGIVERGNAAAEPATEPAAPAMHDPIEPVEAPAAYGRDDVRLDELPDLTEADASDEGASLAAERGITPGGREAFELPELFGGEAGDHESGDDAMLDDEPLFEQDGVTHPAADDAPLVATDAPEAAWPAASATAPAGAVAASEAAGPASAAAAEAPPEAAAPGDVLAGGVWARYGQIWRRRIDDRTLRRSVSDLASALDAPPSTVVALLLARAARRGGAATGAVEVWRWRRGGAERVTVNVDTPLREAVHRLETAHGTGEGDHAPSLVVADLSAVDLDEAVLHLDAPVLALGRSTGDGAWLSLSGERVEPAMVGTLAQVAELLAAPVRLLV